MLLPLVLKQLLVEDCWFVQNANATHYFNLISAVLNDPIFLRFTQYIRKDSTYDLLPFCLDT